LESRASRRGRRSWKNRSGTNVWSFFTIDTERSIVTRRSGADVGLYGADRKGANLCDARWSRST
jgi:hypothetical protein